MSQPFVEIATQSVDEFSMALATRVHFGAQSPLFRGQSCSSWGLTPTVRRENYWQKLGGVQAVGLEAENGFVTSSGEKVESAARSVIAVLRQVIARQGIEPELGSDSVVEAYAQHLGLPTRMLDWSRNPWVAAYFAAAGAGAIEDDGELAVYAVTDIVAPFAAFSGARFPGAKAYGNQNLLAQSGMLLPVPWEVVNLLDHVAAPEKHPAGQGLPEDVARQFPVVRVTLPRRLAPELLHRLREQDINGATMFPGGVGVAALVGEVLRTDHMLHGGE